MTNMSQNLEHFLTLLTREFGDEADVIKEIREVLKQ